MLSKTNSAKNVNAKQNFMMINNIAGMKMGEYIQPNIWNVNATKEINRFTAKQKTTVVQRYNLLEKCN